MNFEQTIRCLRADSYRSVLIAAAGVAVLLFGWIIWFATASIKVVNATTEARMQARASAHPIQARIAGRVIASNLKLGVTVAKGDVLVELEVEDQRRLVAEKRTHVDALKPQIEALRRIIATQERVVANQRPTAVATIAEVRARRNVLAAEYSMKQTEAVRESNLFAKGVSSEVDMVRAKSEARQSRARLGSIDAELRVIEQRSRTADSEQQMRLDGLYRELAKAEGDQHGVAAEIEVLVHEIEKRVIRAPIAGTIAQIAEVSSGAYVNGGDILASIVPTGELVIVGQFRPASALGRIRPGQRARMYFDGFSWARFGSIEAEVTAVASEVRDGKIRVELVVTSKLANEIPWQHGLTGTVEVEVESTTPLKLILDRLGGTAESGGQ